MRGCIICGRGTIPRWGSAWKAWLKENAISVASAATQINVVSYEDTFLDRDELDACSDPANAAITPENTSSGDIDGDGAVDYDDLTLFVQVLTGRSTDATHVQRSDLDCNGRTDGEDIPPMAAALIGE